MPTTTKKPTATKKPAAQKKSVAPKAAAKAPTKVMEIALDNFADIDKSPTQTPFRWCIDTQLRYTQDMKDGLWDWDREESYPVVFEAEDALYVGDGHHTIASAIAAGITTIKAIVHQGTLLDAIAYSYKSDRNKIHGLAVNNSQRRNTALATLKNEELLKKIAVDFCGGSGSEIPAPHAVAAWLGLSPHTIKGAWEALLYGGEKAFSHIKAIDAPWLLQAKLIGQDGKLRPSEYKAKSKPAPQLEQVEQVEQVETPSAPANPATATKSPTEQPESPQTLWSEVADNPPPQATRFTGSAARKRLKEICATTAWKMLDQLQTETDLKLPYYAIEQLREQLAEAIELEVLDTIDTEGTLDSD